MLEIDLDLAEFTVLAPFPHTKAWTDLRKQNRIFNYNWDDYNAGQVVYHPKHMSAERLQELYQYAWDTFYKYETQEEKMFKLLKKVVSREMEDGTFRKRRQDLSKTSFGKNVIHKIA